MKDNWLLGIIPALIIPPVAGWAYYLYMTGEHDFYVLSQSILGHVVLAPLLALGCVLNLGLFFLFIRTEKYRAGRGVIAVTLLYAILTALIKFNLI